MAYASSPSQCMVSSEKEPNLSRSAFCLLKSQAPDDLCERFHAPYRDAHQEFKFSPQDPTIGESEDLRTLYFAPLFLPNKSCAPGNPSSTQILHSECQGLHACTGRSTSIQLRSCSLAHGHPWDKDIMLLALSGSNEHLSREAQYSMGLLAQSWTKLSEPRTRTNLQGQ